MSEELLPSEVRDILKIWCATPGRGMALVEFTNEYARAALVKELALPGILIERTGDIEHAVRHVVERIREDKRPALSIHGFEGAFFSTADRSDAVDMCNFLRETIAAATTRQIWWVTPDTANLFLKRAPDLWSWFDPRLAFHGTVPVAVEPFDLPTPSRTVNIDEARKQLLDAESRIRKGLIIGTSTAVLWKELAYPALANLLDTGAQEEYRSARDHFIDLIYGDSKDAIRTAKIRSDVASLIEGSAVLACAALAGPDDLMIDGALPDVRIQTLQLVGLATLRAGRFAEAERYCRDAYNTAVEAHGAASAQAAIAATSLVSTLTSLGRDEEALPMQKQALEVLHKHLGEEHPDTLKAMSGLAYLYARARHFREAEGIFARVLVTRELVLGMAHPDTVDSRRALAAVYRELHRWTEAQHLLEKALAIAEEGVGTRHLDYIRTAATLAGVYLDENSTQDLLERTLPLAEQTLGPEHPDTLRIMDHLAWSYADTGYLTEAIRLYRRVLQGTTRVRGTSHIATIGVMGDLALTLARRGNIEEALPLMEQAVSGAEATLGPDHPDLQRFHRNLLYIKSLQPS